MEIAYDIKYSARKTISIIVERDRSVVVRAPFNTTEEKINSVIREKKFLLFKKLNHPNKYPIPKPYKEFTNGESLMFLGKLYTLQLTDDKTDEVKFDNAFYIGKSHRAKANELMRKWYMSQAEEKLIPKIKMFAERLGVRYNKIKIAELKFRWGSCTPKDNLNFNWRIIKAPVSVVDYIIVHELAHLLEPNHTPEFWNIISIQLPNYKRARHWLKENGGMLEMEF
ncbi:MAG TPA: SprT family zinc-dependent metalloprotease [Bacteroidia bacterium]|nr:SprT family zinc-dependent metalloprotease [Bacteroidia bacterium]